MRIAAGHGLGLFGPAGADANMLDRSVLEVLAKAAPLVTSPGVVEIR
jgi:hypothetical protein